MCRTSSSCALRASFSLLTTSAFSDLSISLTRRAYKKCVNDLYMTYCYRTSIFMLKHSLTMCSCPYVPPTCRQAVRYVHSISHPFLTSSAPSLLYLLASALNGPCTLSFISPHLTCVPAALYLPADPLRVPTLSVISSPGPCLCRLSSRPWRPAASSPAPCGAPGGAGWVVHSGPPKLELLLT